MPLRSLDDAQWPSMSLVSAVTISPKLIRCYGISSTADAASVPIGLTSGSSESCSQMGREFFGRRWVGSPGNEREADDPTDP